MRLVLVVPLKPDAHDRARALLLDGPPFDPAGWSDLVAGPPVLVDEHHAWATVLEDAFFDSTPGPGDSEGGDVFAPEQSGR